MCASLHMLDLFLPCSSFCFRLSISRLFCIDSGGIPGFEGMQRAYNGGKAGPPEKGPGKMLRDDVPMARLKVGTATDSLGTPVTEDEALSRRGHEFFTEDPYLVEEDVRLLQADDHNKTLASVRMQMERYMQEKGLDFRLTSDLEFNAIPAAYLEGTGYRRKVAFDVGLWDSPPAPKHIPGQNLKSSSWTAWGPPRLVLEVLSDQTERVDRREKLPICRRMGVQEFWLFDPRKVTRALEGWRLDADGLYHPIAANRNGELDSIVLGTRLRGQDYRLEWWDPDLDDWYSVEKQSHAEGHAEGRAATLIASLMDVARFYLDSERLDVCLAALQKRSREDLPSVKTLMQAITSARAPADAVEAILLGTPDMSPESPDMS